MMKFVEHAKVVFMRLRILPSALALWIGSVVAAWRVACSAAAGGGGLVCTCTAMLLLAGCGGDGVETSYQPSFGDRPALHQVRAHYVIGVHPLHNPARLFEVYGPIIDRLNRRIPEAAFMLEASRNYQDYERKLYAGNFDLALPNPYQTVIAVDRGYRVFGKMGDDEAFRGIVLVRRDSGIREIADLRGKVLSFPAATALAAALMPQLYLHERGLPMKDYAPHYVGSQESSIMSAYVGDAAAAATWPPPWLAFREAHPEKAAAMEVKWETPPLVNNGLVARWDFPQALLQRVSSELFALQDDEEGRRLLAALPLSHFAPATNADFEIVRDFLHRFDHTVRRLEELPK